MPLPKPNDGETHDDWIDRCMSNPTMKEEFEDNDQRLATCNTIWDDSRSKEPEKKAAAKPDRRALANAMASVALQRRFREGGEDHEIVGYAAVFYDGTPGTEFRLAPDVMERIMPGAFDEVLGGNPDVVALFNHAPNQVLGRTSAGTVSLSIDRKGLGYRIILGDTTIGRDVAAHVERGDIGGSSFAFDVPTGGESYKHAGASMFIREITRINPLYDVSVATFPAYEATAAHFRTVEDTVREIRAAIGRAGNTEKPKPFPRGAGWKPKSEEDAETRKLREWAENLKT